MSCQLRSLNLLTPISMLALLVLSGFGVAERISLRILPEGAKDETVDQDCMFASFFIEHLRPFEGPALGHPLEDISSVDECARKCGQTPDCAGANFLQNLRGDPLCTLHSTPSESGPPTVDNNNSPLVVLFGISRFFGTPATDLQNPKSTKRSCSRPWSFQKFPRIGPISDKFLLASSDAQRLLSAISLPSCLVECQKNHDCASAIYSEGQRKCRLARISPQKVHGVRNYFRPEPDWDLFESNCSPAEPVDPSNCGFSRINQAGFVEPFSALLLQVRSPHECQKACLATLLSPSTSICRSWTHDSATGRCFLSHLALRGLGRNVLEQMGPTLSSGELDECMSFRLDCRSDSLLLFGHSPLKLFRGHVRSRKRTAKTAGSCDHLVEEAHKFTVHLPFAECGFEKRPDNSHWGNLLVKEGSTELITSRDKLVQANCRLQRSVGLQQAEEEDSGLPHSLKIRLRANQSGGQEGQQQSVSTRVIVLPPTRQRTQHQQSQQFGLSSPPQYRLEVLDAAGRPAFRVEMGDPGFLEIRRVDTNSRGSSRASSNRFGAGEEKMLLANLRAVQSERPDKWMQLIDEDGCISEPTIVNSIQRMDPNRLRIGIKFSGFPDKARVSYQALVKRCRFGCEPECNRKFIVGLGPANGDAKETENMLEEDKNGQSTSPAIRLHRRAIPSPSGQKRHFQLEDQLFEVQSRSAIFSVKETDGGWEEDAKKEVANDADRMTSSSRLACVQDLGCLCDILLLIVEALLLLLCAYLLLWYFQLWLHNFRCRSLIRTFYNKLAEISAATADFNENGNEDHHRGEEPADEGLNSADDGIQAENVENEGKQDEGQISPSILLLAR